MPAFVLNPIVGVILLIIMLVLTIFTFRWLWGKAGALIAKIRSGGGNE